MNSRKMKRKNRKSRFEKKAIAIFIAVSSIYLLGTLSLNSIESALNIEVQRVEEDVEELKAQRDGLNTARQEKVSFENILDVAKKNGYTLNYATEQVAAKKDQDE